MTQPAANPAPDILSFEGLTVARGHTVLAARVTRVLPTGGLLLLTGPNGSGKTSLLRAVAGLLTPREGRIRQGGAAHFLAAQPLAPSLETPRQYLAYQAALAGADIAALPADPFAVTPHLDTPLNRLSTGWRQRVKLTRLVLAPRPLWLLDEPSDGLDSAGIDILQRMVAALREQGGACVIATHDPHLWPGADALPFGEAAA